MDGFLPPVDVGGWLEFQRKRAKQLAQERIDQANQAVGAAAGVGRDWIGRATQSIDGLLPDWAEGAPPPHTPEPVEPAPSPPPSLNAVQDWGAGALDRIGQLGSGIGSGVSSAIDQAQGILPGGRGWDADLARIRSEREAVEQQYPTPEATGPAALQGFSTAPTQVGTPEGERITSDLARTAMEQTPGGRFMTDAARTVARARGFDPNLPMTADTGVQNALQTGLGAAQATGFVSGAVQEGAHQALERLPGGETSVFEGAPLPGGNRLSRDTPVLGGLTTPDELLPFLAGAKINDPEDVTGLLRGGNNVLQGAARRFGTEADPRFGVTSGGPSRGMVNARTMATGEVGRPASLGKSGASPDWGPPPPGGWIDPISREPVRPPPAGKYISMEEFGYWTALKAGENPFAGLSGAKAGAATIDKPRYRWDLYNSPAGVNGEPPGKLDTSPLPRVDWDGLLAQKGYQAKRGTDPEVIKRLLTVYDDDDLPIEAVAPTLGLDPDATRRAAADATDALNALGYPYKKTGNELGAAKSERNTPPDYDKMFAEGGKKPKIVFSYYSPKMQETYYFDSAPEVAAAYKLDADPQVAAWFKGGGKRARVRFVIEPGSRFTPNPPPELDVLRTQGLLDAGKEGIYSPDFLVRAVDGREGIVEVKSLGATGQPAYKIPEKLKYGRKVFEDHWGIPFHIWGEDQIGRRFMADLGATNLDSAADHPLLANIAAEVADPARQRAIRQEFVTKMGANALQGRESPVATWLGETGSSTDHFLAFNAESKYPPVAAEEMQALPTVMSVARDQAARHTQTGVSGSTFTATGGPGSGGVPETGFMVAFAPERMQQVNGWEVSPRILAQYRLENKDYLRAFPEAYVGTWKTTTAAGAPVTQLDLSLHVPDGEAATAIGNLNRQDAVYNIDRSISSRLDPQDWAPTALSPEERNEQARQLLEAAATRAGERRAGRGDLRLPGDVPLGPRQQRLADADAARAARAQAAVDRRAARGRGVRAGADRAGGADTGQPGALAGAGDVEPDAGQLGAPPAGGLALDGRGGPDLGRGLGIAAQSGSGDWRSALDAALAGVAPYGAARTGGERVFDLAAGTAGGVAGAATADEDAPWQERAKRFGAGAVAGSLVGPTARGGLGQFAGRELTDRSTSGAAAGRSGGPQRPGRLGGLTLGDVPELMGALPLIVPTSQAANFTSGLARSAERVLGVAFQGRPDAALVDLAAMARELPGATRKIGASFRKGPTAATPGMTGPAVAGDLMSRGTGAADAATSGVRLNAALDEFWRQLNEAGAGAQSRYRGFGAGDTASTVKEAGEFATFGGGNSAVAKKLTELKQVVRDPNASLFDRATGAAVTSMAPYVMMPERLLRATVGNLLPVEAGVGMVKALRRGDRRAAAEFRGRALAGMATTGALVAAYHNGGLTGDPPQDANERRRREAQGERWNTFAVPGGARVPTRYLGALGMQMDAVATTLDAMERAGEKGGDPGAIAENGFNAAARWTLDNSYLSDLVDFGDAVKGQQGAAGALRQTAAGLPSRFTGPVTGAINALDPYERQSETFPEMVANRTGLRALTPTRIDPATGEDQRRTGNAFTRYFGERGSEQSPEGAELAAREVSPRVIGRTEKYEGAVQSPEARRTAQRALGREAQAGVRAALAKPDYAGLSDEEKQKRLRAAISRSADTADIDLGEGVTRGIEQQARRAWDAVPKFVGIDPKADPDTIRRENDRLQLAQTVAGQYREKYGEGPWRSQMAKDEPELYKLVGRPRNPAPVLDAQKKKIEAQYGVKLG